MFFARFLFWEIVVQITVEELGELGIMVLGKLVVVGRKFGYLPPPAIPPKFPHPQFSKLICIYYFHFQKPNKTLNYKTTNQ